MFQNNHFEDTPQSVLKTVAYHREQPDTKIRWDVELSSGENAQENYFTLRASVIKKDKIVTGLFSLHVQNLSKDFDKAVVKAKDFVQEGDLFTWAHGKSQSINRGSSFRFGKYSGKSFVDVANDDPSYFLYIRNWANSSLLDSKRLQVNKQALLDDVEANKIADDVFQAKQKQDIENKEKRATEAQKSNYVGSVDEAIDIEATVLHVKVGESEYGFWTKTKLVDKDGNIFIYWNEIFGSATLLNVLSDERPSVMDHHGEIFCANAGDKVKFRATVKEHFEDKFYFGAKTTKINRARKLEIVELTFVGGARKHANLYGGLNYLKEKYTNVRVINAKTKKEISYRDLPNPDKGERND